ncbi:MAG: FkbM family methyltransferase [Deltaproteobacteria bacterium]
MKKLIFSLFKFVSRAMSGSGLWKFAPVRALWILLYRAFSPRGEVLIECQGSRMFVLAEYGYGGVGNILLMRGVYEEYETELFKSLIHPGMTVIDIGANIGYFTLIAAKSLQGTGRVYAFEPEPNNFKLLAKSVRANDYKNIEIFPKAVSRSRGTLKLYVDKTSPVHPSFAKENVPESAGYIEVETVALDDFLAERSGGGDNGPALIKMDTQGAEGYVIEGAGRMLSRGDVKIIMEFWPLGLRNLGTDPLKLLETLRGYGFIMKIIDEASPYPEQIDASKVMEISNKARGGNGYVNLLLEK